LKRGGGGGGTSRAERLPKLSIFGLLQTAFPDNNTEESKIKGGKNASIASTKADRSKATIVEINLMWNVRDEEYDFSDYSKKHLFLNLKNGGFSLIARRFVQGEIN
jgi:hypothetical protein